MLSQRKWYYAKVLRRKATMISLKVAPYFYALTENFGDPTHDYILQHEQGLLSRESKLIYEALLGKGAMHTIDLRRETRLSSKESDTRFNRALEELQGDFKILPVGVAEAGAWRYAFIYDTVHHHYPKLIEQARDISRKQARAKLLALYLKSVGAIQQRDVIKLFGWKQNEVDAAIKEIWEITEIREIKGVKGEWIVLKELV
ncbi:MAG: winged helix DNA-binding domain-containing protein [Chloroflexi bacterium]|nr:winged helix DNA-binding domain-containing protein [Chloroflexota bacterium]